MRVFIAWLIAAFLFSGFCYAEKNWQFLLNSSNSTLESLRGSYFWTVPIRLIGEGDTQLTYESTRRITATVGFSDQLRVYDVAFNGYRSRLGYKNSWVDVGAGRQKLYTKSAKYLSPLKWFENDDPIGRPSKALTSLIIKLNVATNSQLKLWVIYDNPFAEYADLFPENDQYVEWGGEYSVSNSTVKNTVLFNQRVVEFDNVLVPVSRFGFSSVSDQSHRWVTEHDASVSNSHDMDFWSYSGMLGVTILDINELPIELILEAQGSYHQLNRQSHKSYEGVLEICYKVLDDHTFMMIPYIHNDNGVQLRLKYQHETSQHTFYVLTQGRQIQFGLEI